MNDPQKIYEIRMLLKYLFNCLKGRNKEIVVMRIEGFTFKEIGKVFKVTPSRINDIYKREIRRLRLSRLVYNLVANIEGGDY